MSGFTCPGLCSICPSPADRPCPRAAQERADRESELFVDYGLGHDSFGVFRRSANGGRHRVKSPALPMTNTREECERNLAAYLARRR